MSCVCVCVYACMSACLYRRNCCCCYATCFMRSSMLRQNGGVVVGLSQHDTPKRNTPRASLRRTTVATQSMSDVGHRTIPEDVHGAYSPATVTGCCCCYCLSQAPQPHKTSTCTACKHTYTTRSTLHTTHHLPPSPAVRPRQPHPPWAGPTSEYGLLTKSAHAHTISLSVPRRDARFRHVQQKRCRHAKRVPCLVWFLRPSARARNRALSQSRTHEPNVPNPLAENFSAA
jgi:hypothetical protein